MHNGMDSIKKYMGTILKWVLMKLFGRSWIGLMWFRIGDKWQAVVKTVMNLRAP
jgi:hypothetical protein